MYMNGIGYLIADLIAFQTVKIITVPGQGAGRKPLRAAGKFSNLTSFLMELVLNCDAQVS